MRSSMRCLLVVLTICSMLYQQQVNAQAVLAPVENYAINRAVGGLIANRILAARGLVYNDAAWMANAAANDPVYKATMAAVGSRMTAVNVASTVLGIGLAVAGAPVWLTVAAGLGVIAAGTILVVDSAKTKIVVQNGMIVTVPAPAADASYEGVTGTLWKPSSFYLGAGVYRGANCTSATPQCYQFPPFPQSRTPPVTVPFFYCLAPSGVFSEVCVPAYSLDELAKYYAADKLWGNYTEDLSGDSIAQCGQANDSDPCMHTVTSGWVGALTVVPTGTSTGQVHGQAFYSSTYVPDQKNQSTPYYTFPMTLTDVGVDSSMIPKEFTNLDAAVQGLSSQEASQAISKDLLANIANSAWEQAAAQPGYAGQPYSAAEPITKADVEIWIGSPDNTLPSVEDLLRPPANPAVDTSGVPISPTQQVTSTNPGGSSGSNPASGGLTNVNVVNTPRVDLGADPGVATPTLESPPTGADILSPLTSLFPELRGFQTPAHAAECPKPTFDLFGKSIVMDSHCIVAEQNRALLASVMAAVWLIIGLLILLSA